MRRFPFFFCAVLALLTASCNLDLVPEEMQTDADVLKETPVTTIMAGFDEASTKSALSLSNGAANVVWKYGDEFVFYQIYENYSYNAASFRTDKENVTKADFTSNSQISNDATHYCAVYPASAGGGSLILKYNGTSYIGFKVTIPDQQVATAGSFDPEANLSFAYAPSFEQTNNLSFINLLSLLKIRVTGEKAASLQSIKVTCTGNPVAGPALIHDFAAVPKLLPYEWSKSSVNLAGPFSADTDYYIALAPGTYSSVSLSFLFADGGVVSKTLNQSVTFNRATIKNLGTFDLTQTSDPDVILYQEHTKGIRPVTICVLPDGYVDGDRDLFIQRATDGMAFMFNVEPYKSMRDYFNIYFMWVPSQESGASVTDGNGNVTIRKNTAFNSRWGQDSYKDMTADKDKVYGYVEAHCPEIVKGEKTIAEVPVLLLINDTRYGGKAHASSDGSSYCQVPHIVQGNWSYANMEAASNEPDGTYATRTLSGEEIAARFGIVSGDWRNVLVHEFGGHSFGRLLDEYWNDEYETTQSDIRSHAWPVPYGLNISGWYEDAKIPWKELLDKKDALVARNTLYSRIGKYQGGQVSLFNRWRSEEVNCMFDNRPYFSAWQRILIARRITQLSGETFSLDGYLAIDNPVDPIRDVISSPAPTTKGPVKILPMLPPPELIDNTSGPVPVRIQ